MKVGIDVRGVPADLVAAVEEDARKRDVSVHDAVVEKLCEKYALPFEPSGYPFSTAAGSNHWNLRVPPELRELVRSHAAAAHGTMTGVILTALASAYGVPGITAKKRSPRALDAEAREEIRLLHGEGESVRALSRMYGVTRETVARALRD